MTVVEFLARLAALVPPPRCPLVRYHGVLAPHSKWRSAVVPRPPDSNARAARAACAAPSAAQPRPSGCNRKPAGVGADGGSVDTRGSVPRLSLRGDGSTPRCHEADPKKWAALPETVARADAPRRPEPLPAAAPAPEPAPRQPLLRPPEAGTSITPGDVEVTPQGISVRRVDHLLGGLLLATSPRVDWATLLRRTFDVDVLACTRCQGRLRLMSVITELATVRRLLEHLGIPARAPPILPRARDPAASVAAG